jgi:hypothetical protein
MLKDQVDGFRFFSQDGGVEEEGWALEGQAQVNMALSTPCLIHVGLTT